MDLDLRIPIGLFFVAVGLIMTIFGLTSNPALYDKSLGINVNLAWGIVELIFGSLMIAFGRSRRELEAKPEPIPARKAATSRHDLSPPAGPKTKPPVTHG